MGEYLPGDINNRLIELRTRHGFSKQQVAEALGINKSTYGRCETGDTRTVNSDILIGLAKLYNVTTDYILGISDTPEKTYFDIEQLGLSVEAAKNLCSKNVNSDVVNELLLNKKFAHVTRLLSSYYKSEIYKTQEMKNQVLGWLYSLSCIEGIPQNDEDIIKLKDYYKVIGEPTIQADLENIRALFMAAIKEIKNDIIKAAEEGVQTKNNILTADIITAVNNNIDRDKVGKLETYEEQLSYITQAVVQGIRIDPNMTEEKIKELIPVIRKGLDVVSKNE